MLDANKQKRSLPAEQTPLPHAVSEDSNSNQRRSSSCSSCPECLASVSHAVQRLAASWTIFCHFLRSSLERRRQSPASLVHSRMRLSFQHVLGLPRLRCPGMVPALWLSPFPDSESRVGRFHSFFGPKLNVAESHQQTPVHFLALPRSPARSWSLLPRSSATHYVFIRTILSGMPLGNHHHRLQSETRKPSRVRLTGSQCIVVACSCVLCPLHFFHSQQPASKNWLGQTNAIELWRMSLESDSRPIINQ